VNTSLAQRNLALLLEELDIPPSAYERADRRYQDLGEFFSGNQARCASYSPHIYPQGSFRLGTVVRPIGADDEFDLDVGCRLTQGISKGQFTQEQLKTLVGRDLEAYRVARGIQNRLDEKRRCWRLSYRDELPFHMDVVPSIPEEQLVRRMVQERIQRAGVDVGLAAQVAGHAGAITDNQTPNYRTVSPDWKISNSEGFALWFESRLRLAQMLLERNAAAARTTIDKLPSRRWGSPLQTAIRVLKRHRDQMFAQAPDCKPISVIITTLAARAYNGETDLETTLSGVLDRMEAHIQPTAPRVPNPVNPQEDFADKWASPEHAHLNLEQNVRAWIRQARADLLRLREATSEVLLEKALSGFGVQVGKDRLAKAIGSSVVIPQAAIPVTLQAPPTKPWAF
jgi:hypothetical protein